ncbi:MAG: hypothetical protein Q8K36_02810 [Alphaproteobacteria bacterium]|nr:hypothetical protein [Alphaproteobacteria bacterium]
MHFIIAILLMGILTGCNPFAGYAPHSEKIQNRYWARAHQQPVPKLYCYRTLGEHQCYAQPEPGKEHLLVGDAVDTQKPKEKAFWQYVNLHPLLGVDDETMRRNVECDQQAAPTDDAPSYSSCPVQSGS